MAPLCCLTRCLKAATPSLRKQFHVDVFAILELHRSQLSYILLGVYSRSAFL